jgi:hypothetical protein
MSGLRHEGRALRLYRRAPHARTARAARADIFLSLRGRIQKYESEL